MQNIRIGLGYDVHRLEAGRPLILGGVHVPHHKGCMGHSDADVVLHVICDALLGAANLRNIGYHFSDKSPEWKNADSKVFLTKVHEMITEKGYAVGNVDVTVVLQEPKLNPHIPAMQQIIANILQTDTDNVSVKATTGEHIGFVGRTEGIAAHAVALIFKKDS
jgi:2-C-methyl-D-erythritol 2,4-cyclodiphosphate synthase